MNAPTDEHAVTRPPPMLSKLLIFVAASLVSTSITAADPERKRAKAAEAVKPKIGTQQKNSSPRVYDGRSGWYPNDANQLRFGSQIWWDQMQKEGRIGRPSDD